MPRQTSLDEAHGTADDGLHGAARRGLGNPRRLGFPTKPAIRDEEGAGSVPILLRPVEVAALLGLSRSKVFELLAGEEVPCVRIGRAVRVPRRQLECWIDDQVAGGSTALRGGAFRRVR